MYYFTIYHSPLGPLLLASNQTHLTGLWLEGQKYYAATLNGDGRREDRFPILCTAADWLDRYFAGLCPALSEVPLDPQGSSFRQAVWTLLCEIPYGQVTTYGALAKQLATRIGRSSMSSQAVGGAVGHNPISILIPCHRVVGSDGSLTGYAGGVEKKAALLTQEGVNLSDFRHFLWQ